MSLFTNKKVRTFFQDGDVLKITVVGDRQGVSVPAAVEFLRFEGCDSGILSPLSKREDPLTNLASMFVDGFSSETIMPAVLNSDSFSDSRRLAESYLFGSRLDIATEAIEESESVRFYMITDLA